jgi:NADPH:quinone reductase-like Zn-dependent oxidoreductase
MQDNSTVLGKALSAIELSGHRSGEIKAVVQEVLPLKEAVQARRAMEAGGVVGGLVLIP